MTRCVTIAVLALLAASGRAPAAPDDLNDHICGPRAVRYVLAHYGQYVRLSELIAEMLPANVSEGSTFADVAEALRRRGLSCSFVDLRRYAASGVRWPHPIVVHLTTPDGIGHFAVLRPAGASAPEGTVWRGDEFVNTVPFANVIDDCSAVALATAPASEPRNLADCLGADPLPRSAVVPAAIGLGLLALTLLVRVSVGKRVRPL